MHEMSETETKQRPSSRLLRLKDVQMRVGLGRSTIYRWMSFGQFPEPYQLGGHSVAWLESDIETWIAEKTSRSA